MGVVLPVLCVAGWNGGSNIYIYIYTSVMFAFVFIPQLVILFVVVVPLVRSLCASPGA